MRCRRCLQSFVPRARGLKGEPIGEEVEARRAPEDLGATCPSSSLILR